MARPVKQINQKSFESMCSLQCTEPEICAFLDVTDKTLNKWCKQTYHKSFSEVFREKRQVGKISLRRYQFKQAENNPTMAIFLGKNWLGQSDNPQLLDSYGNEVEDDPITVALKEEAKRLRDEDANK